MSRLYKRPGSRKWWADFNDPSHPKADKTGRVRIPLFSDKDRSQEELGLLIGSATNSEASKPLRDSSFLAFKEKFLNQVSPNRVTASQYKRAIANLESGSPLPIKMLSQVTPSLVSDIKASWIRAGRGLYVRNREIQSIKAMMRKAEAWGLVKEQKWDSVKKDKEPKGRLLWWTMDEVKGKLYPGCPGIWQVPARLSVRAGFRPGEAYWLPWDHVDFQRERLHITHVYEGKGLLWGPKDHERRWVPMPPDLYEYLSKLSKMARGRFVFEEGAGRPTLPSMCTYAGKLIKKTGLKGSLYTGRHTYGSHLASGGANAKYIMEVMGHSKLEMTNRYMHLAPEVQQQGIIKYLPS